MSIAKEKAYSLKDRAKDLGYDLKLTHCQELVAQLEGFSNRHSLLKNELKSNSNVDFISQSINHFIKSNNIDDSNTISEMHSLETIQKLKKSMENCANEILCKFITKLKYFEFTDDANQTDCIFAFNEKQAKDFFSEYYEHEDGMIHYTIKEIPEETLHVIKMFTNDEAKGKKISAFKHLQKELKEGVKIPNILYSNY